MVPGPYDDDVSVATVLRSGAGSEPSVFALTVEHGPDRGRRFELDQSVSPRPLVGQSPACEIRLGDRSISRRHAAIEIGDRELGVTDLRSTNGTFINGVPVIEARVRGGEEIRLGETVLRVERRTATSRDAPPPATGFGKLVGQSPEMRRLYPLCERLAAATVPVVIEGETGTGKEVLAESLHDMGPRKNGPFVVFDCTAVPPTLIESALFGHERGAFTGATSQRRGVFEQANGGTLLIDEIGDLDLALQAKLLRAIQRSEVQRVGADRWSKVDVRVIAATRRDLDREVQAGRFRDDLFFRLTVARIELPPLRRRTGDVLFLAKHFFYDLGGTTLPYELFQQYEDYGWPGNVRELYNAVAGRIALGDLAPPLGSGAQLADRGGAREGADTVERILMEDLPFSRAKQKMQEEFERRYLERVLALHGGNVSKAAAASGIARRYFHLLLARRGEK
jgi:two-component system, NtrC family, response regulator HydG